MKNGQPHQPVLGLRISPKLETAIKEFAAREGESISTVVRTALRQTLARAGVDLAAQPQVDAVQHRSSVNGEF